MRRAFIGTAALILGLVLGPAARACGPEVVIRFIDSSPDLFIIENKSLEPWTLLSLEFQAANSAGRVVFDTDFGGAGASEPQQFEAVEGEVGLMKAPVVADGAEELTLNFTNFQQFHPGPHLRVLDRPGRPPGKFRRGPSLCDGRGNRGGGGHGPVHPSQNRRRKRPRHLRDGRQGAPQGGDLRVSRGWPRRAANIQKKTTETVRLCRHART